MTFSEFKAWFKGYTEQIKTRPTEQEWKRICEELDKVQLDCIPHPIYYPSPIYIPPNPLPNLVPITIPTTLSDISTMQGQN